MTKHINRRVKLQGGCNFRDLGGYRGRFGTTRWGLIYRSGTLAGLTPDDMSLLRSRGIRSVCDFRSNAERSRHPNPWQGTPEVAYWFRDHERGKGDLRAVFFGQGETEETGMEAMRRMYRDLPMSQREAYRAMFRCIATGEVPMVFHCTAGKDRTGVAAALLLEALGIERDAIVDDYLLTNDASDLARARSTFLAPAGGGSQVAEILTFPAELEAVLWRADVSFIGEMFESVDARHGSTERYLHEILGIDRKILASIRERLLEDY